MGIRSNVLWITRTGVFIALLIVMQVVTSGLSNQLITGSIVNLILIISVMTCGMATGVSVGIISPIVAKFFSIGPIWTIIPFIIIGNCVLVLLWYIIGNQNFKTKKLSYILALLVASLSKFLTLYYGIVKFAIPTLLDVPEKKAVILSNMFSVPQLVTALIGGGLAIIILPILKPVISNKISE